MDWSPAIFHQIITFNNLQAFIRNYLLPLVISVILRFIIWLDSMSENPQLCSVWNPYGITLIALLSVYLFACLSVSVRPSVCPFVRWSVRSFVCPSVRLSVCLLVCMPACLSVRPSVYLSVCFSLCPFVCSPLKTFSSQDRVMVLI